MFPCGFGFRIVIAAGSTCTGGLGTWPCGLGTGLGFVKEGARLEMEVRSVVAGFQIYRVCFSL